MTWKITSKFGQQEAFRHRPHTGIDFGMPTGTELRSIHSGEIVRIVDYGNSNLGKGVFVKWQDGKVSIYGHLSEYAKGLKVGDKVNTGDLLGYAGSTGHSTGSHLHFAIKEGDRFLDPSPYIDLIQNMDNPTMLAKLSSSPPIITTPTLDFKFNLPSFLSNVDNYNGFLNMLKANFIDIFNLFDYTIFMQYFENLVKFFFV